jgi:hypothetical protein
VAENRRKLTAKTADLVLRSLPFKGEATDTGKRLRAGQIAVAYGTSDDGQWTFVDAPEGRGWAFSALLGPMTSGWRVAQSLERLKKQLDEAAPNRKRSHDGSIGDRAHASRSSDHNPNEAGVVTALDFTHDPANGCDCVALAEALRASRDPRIKYVIFKRQMFSSKVRPWAWRDYRGANAHLSHLHISVDPDPTLYDDDRPWEIGKAD